MCVTYIMVQTTKHQFFVYIYKYIQCIITVVLFDALLTYDVGEYVIRNHKFQKYVYYEVCNMFLCRMKHFFHNSGLSL